MLYCGVAMLVCVINDCNNQVEDSQGKQVGLMMAQRAS